MSMFNTPGFFIGSIIIALLVVSFALGTWLAQALRMAGYGWKFGVILLATLASIVVIYFGWPPKLGVDLGGGAILVYRVDKQKTDWRPDKMDALVTSISKRLNPGGTKELTIRGLGNDMVEIVMPAVKGANEEQRQAESDQVKRLIQTQGAMEFRVVATKRRDEALIEKAMATTANKVLDSSGRELARWCPVRTAAAPDFRNDEKIATRIIKDSKGKAGDSNSEHLEILVLSGVSDPYNVKGGDMRDARPSLDEAGMPQVNFTFNPEGANALGKLTGDHVPEGDYKYRMAIILDDKVQTAPTLNGVITDSGRIMGNFTQKEVKELVDILNAGSLPAALEQTPVRDMTTEATLGADTIRQSTNAMIIAAVTVPLFMIFYYHFAGVVAVIVLSMNMLILVALMILIRAPFTLSGLAGLALTVGMAVDNNVLIYERLREELAHGAALRMAIRNAFHRVGVVIIDANITHLIAATVLFAVGTEQVKGFAVTFWLGAVLSIWATMFVAHIFFEVAERKRWIAKVTMMQMIGKTNIDFMGWFPAAATFSVVITVLGIAVAVMRGPGLFDIDFTGGVSVQAVFREPQDIGDIRTLIETRAKELPDGTVSNLKYRDEPSGLRFAFVTSNHNGEEVQKTIQDLFSGKLQTSELSYEVGSATVAKPAEAKGKTSVAPTPEVKSVPKDSTAKSPPKPAEAAPAAKKAEEKSSAAGPEPKPDTKPVDKPADGKQSNWDLPADNVVASLGFEGLLVAQAEKPEAKSEPTTKRDTDKGDAGTPAKAESKLPAGVVYQAELHFQTDASQTSGDKDRSVKYEEGRIRELVENALQSNGVSKESVRIDLNNSESLPSAPNWTLKISAAGDSQVLTPAKFTTVLTSLQSTVSKMPYFPGVDVVGSAVAADTQFWAIVALVASWSLIILYLWIRFQGVAFGLAAVIALIHDVLVMLGAIAFSVYLAKIPGMTTITLVEPFKINLQIVAAFLTIIGYSVNDTIIVFDRIREVRGKAPAITRQIVNDATNQTLSRTVLTSLTVMMVVIVLYIWGGQAVHGFAFALIIGVLTGTYSSIYVAAPVLLWLLHPKEMQASKEGR